MKTKPKPLEKSDRGFDAKTFWRHYVATVDTDQEWSQERPQPGRASNRLFLFLLLFHIFLIGSVVLFNLVSERPKPVFVDNSAPTKTTPKKAVDKQAPNSNVVPAIKQGETVEHRVAQGDTLKSIADNSGATQDEIAKLNHIDVNMQLAVGSVLRVPKPKSKPPVIPVGLQPSRVEEKSVSARVSTTPTTSTTLFAAVEPSNSSKKVESSPPPASAPKKTETIASKSPEDKPKPKVEDTPPAVAKAQAKEKVEEAPPKPKPTEAKAVAKSESTGTTAKSATTTKATETPATAKPAVAGKSHTVKPGETFYSISRKYGVKVEDLMRLNSSTDPAKLREGIVLKVPAKG